MGRISIESLREQLRIAFQTSTGEVLITTLSKNSKSYDDLREDIYEQTHKFLSQGTLLNFFDESKNRYHSKTIKTIEQYIEKVEKNRISNLPIVQNEQSDNVNNKLQERSGEEICMFAKKIYIELTTRKAAIPIDEENDVIEEIYNSWYKLFCVIREEIKILPVSCFTKQDNQVIIIDLTKKILNEVLRPHLTAHQAKFRSWLEKTKQNPRYRNFAPQKLQKKYPDYKNLIISMKSTNGMIINIAEKLLQLIH